MKICAAASEYIFVCVAFLQTFQCFLKNVQLLLKENVQMVFFVFKQMCGCFWKHFIFLNERVAAFENILTTASERKM